MANTTSLKNYLTVEPTSEQTNALDLSEKFINNPTSDDFLIIRGSAGTGKSTLIKAIAEYLNHHEIKFVLAAPTGKAAKVIQRKTNYAARTIHSLIYTPEPLKHGCGVKMVRKQNTSIALTVFIIDEASMISDVLSTSDNFIATKPLLTDLLDYIKQGNPANRVIFIGDVYQLPPVKSNESPALSPVYLVNNKGLKGEMIELTEVKRQDKDSYILKNATLLRQCIEKGIPFPGIKCRMLPKSTAALVKYMELYDQERFNKVAVIAWTNKDVNWFNNAIRDRLGYNPAILVPGDQVALHHNWVGNGRMIMKGETALIKSVESKVEKYADLQFTNAQVEFTDGSGEKFNVVTKVLLDAIRSADGEIGFERENALFAETMKYNAVFRDSRMPSDDAYIGAMRLRYAYASTCHKAQGGEWDNVILHPYMQANDYRWQYTAITRAANELYSFAA